MATASAAVTSPATAGVFHFIVLTSAITANAAVMQRNGTTGSM